MQLEPILVFMSFLFAAVDTEYIFTTISPVLNINTSDLEEYRNTEAEMVPKLVPTVLHFPHQADFGSCGARVRVKPPLNWFLPSTAIVHRIVPLYIYF